MTALPTELWLIIFDLVIRDGIIRVDDCDHTKFPYIQSILSAANLHDRSYDSYHRLRLVCRRFKAILGDPPSQILSPSSVFPLSPTIRAVILYAWLTADFQLLSAEMSSCRRVVYLDVTCGHIPSPYRPTLSDFLGACAERALHSVCRLALRIVNDQPFKSYEHNFWVRLHDAFSWLVTLVITEESPDGGCVILEAANRLISFEWLEILYMGRGLRYAGCRFPRLRHASVWSFHWSELQIFDASTHLESLLVRSPYSHDVNMGLHPRLKLLGIQDSLCRGVFYPGGDLEHLWVFIDNQAGYYRSIMELLKRLPQIPRVTIEFSSSFSPQGRMKITQDLQGMDFAFIGMKIRPGVDSDGRLIIGRLAASAGV